MAKRYVITDPCYILPEDMWDKCIEHAEKVMQEDKCDWSDVFSTAVEAALTTFTNSNAWASDTGYGDWSNCLHGPYVHYTGGFCADSGMVCICEYTEAVEERIKDMTIDNGCAALFDAEGPLKVNFNKDAPDWTVVEIEDAEGNEWHTDIPYDEDEEDE